ncbi:UDP-N-acetylmuramate dehydrogenase [Parabacteroides pacaensis]|uniref:UDP-N-acetylmuramate dehydrogenase n=1 Tax=Parabacteroides pacaensis TaxID=2086575 RepID=UPI000D11406E|nr:UDP-N-acetylmuramate dehydrogenase [Parabacteroides pacaensis]
MEIKQNYSLEKHNTFRLPVKARWFLEYDTEEDIVTALRDEYFMECYKIHIGAGSNLLFLNDFNGIILHSRIKDITVISENEESVCLKVGSGVIWDELVQYAVSHGWGGIENLSHIPGEVGAAAIQNIGAYGVEVKDVIDSVEGYHIPTLEKQVFSKAECQYAYRSSIFKTEYADQYIIAYVNIRLSKKPLFSLSYGNLKDELAKYPEISLQTIRDAIIAIRSKKLPDPEQIGNAGSFFMNPVVTEEEFQELKNKFPDIPSYPASDNKVKVPAAWLIEQCGFKGQAYGQAGVYDKQALVLVNLGNADGNEIALLADIIIQTVEVRFGIRLRPEVKYIC